MTPIAARLTGISRRFGLVSALDGAHLELRAGEVHGVLGENGAGKTTLLRIVGGILRPDAGSIRIDGREAVLESPRDAWAHGIGLVHQHFTLVPALTVLENLALGHRSAAGGWKLPYGRMRRQAEALQERTGLSAPLDAPVEELGVGDRQRVEILKALLREPRLLMLDEPTAVLAPSEIASLFSLLRALAAEGRAVVLVAHKLDEVLSVADRVTVLRDGRTVLEQTREASTASTLVEAMMGGRSAPPDAEARRRGRRPSGNPTAPVATLDGVSVRGRSGTWALDGVSLAVSRGEIVGVAGVEGNGQRELAELLSGRLAAAEGRVVIPAGVGFIPQDRTTEGLVGDFDLAENAALAWARLPEMRRGPVLRWGALRARADELRARFGIRAPDVRTRGRVLSGGNQQRLVVGRELSIASDLLVAENPTRGLDVAATLFVHEELRRLVDAGAGAPGIVLISTDLDEVLDLSDRIFALVRGRLHAVPDAERTREGVGARMVGGGIGAA